MTNEGLPKNVHDFILRYIDSVADLEALLFFKKNPDREWSAELLSHELRTNISWSSKQIEWLKSKGFIQSGSQLNAYRYNPNNIELDLVISDLLKVYTQKRFSVISLISDRLARIKEFADAFVFRKDDK